MAFFKRRSLVDRLSGTVEVDDSLDAFDDDAPRTPSLKQSMAPAKGTAPASSASSVGRMAIEDTRPDSSAGQLPVDVYQTPSEIVIRAFVAGVRPDELSISIGRDLVVIEGSRMEREQITSKDSFSRELFWGSFSRAVQLPQEIDVDGASATAKDGLLTLILPKLDKARQTKLRVRAG